MASQPVYEFYAELVDYRPAMWRRFQAAGNITLARLAYIVMVMYEMRASHPFSLIFSKSDPEEILSNGPYDNETNVIPFPFERRLLRFELPSHDTGRLHRCYMDASKITLRQLTRLPGSVIHFFYDFGCEWDVMLRLEAVKSMPELDGRSLPRVLEGEGFGIIEDSGGSEYLMELRDNVMCRPRTRGYREFCDWYGSAPPDMNSFDLDDMNFRLSKLPRVYREIYELDLTPTRRSQDIIERRYMDREKSKK